MLINLSNHPSAKWDSGQKQSVEKQYDSVTDLPFPDIDPMADELYIIAMAKKIVEQCLNILKDNLSEQNNAVHIMGEMTLTYAVVSELQKHNIKCVASTSRREVAETRNGWKNSIFRFCRFREYVEANVQRINCNNSI